MFRLTLAGLLFVLAASPQQPAPAAAPRRVALVIGNSNYTSLPKLPAVARELPVISASLRDAGFEIYTVQDFKIPDFFTHEELEFRKHLHEGDVCVVYYAGYALQGGDDNYLLPVNFNPQDTQQMQTRAYHFKRLQTWLEVANVALKIFLLETPPPITDAVQGQSGIGLMEPQFGENKETTFGSAVFPTNWAPLAPDGGIGLFTQFIAKDMAEPGLSLAQLFDKVRQDVGSSSGGKQIPYFNSNVVMARFTFHEAVKPVTPVSPPEIPKPTLPVTPPTTTTANPPATSTTNPPATATKNPPTPEPAPPGPVLPPPTIGPHTGIPTPNRIDREEYLWIRPGKFMMGCVAGDSKCSDAEKPRHEVTLTKGFWMGRNEVEYGSYQRYVESAEGKKAKVKMPSVDRGFKASDFPMNTVRWDEADAYCKWAGGRLPTEAEWEYAARGGFPDEIYPMNSENSRDKANFAGKMGNDIYEYLAPVRKFDPNPYGLYDMAGNVWEWVADWFGPYSGGPVTDPKGPASGKEHVIRGGSWDSDPTQQLRISFRKSNEKSGPSIGFRCVIEDTPESRKNLVSDISR